MIDHDARPGTLKPLDEAESTDTDAGTSTEVGDGNLTEPTEDRGSPSRRLALLAAVVVAVARYAFAADRRTLHVVPDELGVAGMAKWLSGTGDWNMLDAPTWRPGPSVLLAPLYWISNDPETLVRMMLGVNAIVAGASAVILLHLVSRLTSLEPLPALVVTAVTMLMPAGFSASAHVWAEPLVTLTFLLATATTLRAWGNHRATAWVAPITIAGVGYTTHGRLLALLATTTAIAVWRGSKSRNWAMAATGAVVGASSWFVSNRFTTWVQGNVWDNPRDSNSASSTAGRLAKPLEVLDALTGQLWYLVTSSALMWGVGAVAVCVAATRNHPGHKPATTDARLLIVLILPLMGTSAVFMSDRPRPDHLVYGRYNDAIMLPILAIGAAWLWERPLLHQRRAALWVVMALVLVTVELSVFLDHFHAKQLAAGDMVKPMIAGLAPSYGLGATVSPLAAGLTACMVFVILLGTAHMFRFRKVTTATVALGVVIGGGALTHHAFGNDLNSFASTGTIREMRSELPEEDAIIGVGFMPDEAQPSIPVAYQLTISLMYEWYLSDVTLDFDRGLDDDVGPYVLAPTNDLLLNTSGGTIIWTDPERAYALWLEPDAGVLP